MNGEDDTIDLLSGISTDENGNHIPDECDVFGDVDGDADVDVDDILRVLGGFSDPEMFPEADIQPCGGNGIVDVDDILWILAAFAGENLCP